MARVRIDHIKNGIAALLVAVLLVASGSAFACVGKTLLVGTTGTVQQDLMAQMLSLLITERTGTTVKIVKLDSNLAAHEALLKADLDMYVEYTGVGQVQILQKEAIADAAQLYKAVKATYNEELNLIWLKPLGFENKTIGPAGVAAEAAPVVRKDTLKKFPALARLINKLGGRIDAASLAKLETAASGGESKKVAREFLRQNRLI
jgi:osmoprotectant transport system substrate-binding protein